MNRQLATVAVTEVAPAGLSLAALGGMLLAPAHPAGLILLVATLGWLWFGTARSGSTRPGAGTGLPARLVLAAAAVAAAVQETTGPGWVPAAAAVGLAGLLLAEGVLAAAVRPWFQAVRLPGVRRPRTGSVAVWLAGSALVAWFGLAALLGWPGWAVLAAVPAAALPAVAAAALAAGRWRTGHRADLAGLRAAVRRHRPRFLLYFSAPPGSEYQARMWLPHLARIGEPFLVVTPEPEHLPALAAGTGSPVVTYRSFEALDALLVPELRAAFYVNNGMKNAHCVRYTALTHVQLYHGDSDKAVTASPVNAMFDRLFVAGQAAIDRFATHGVEIPAEKFRIVGRPQVADVERATVPVSGVTEPVVLYAPTWFGAHADSHYCSLPVAETILTGLLARGATVVFRPHPYARTDRRTAELVRRADDLLARDRAATGRAHRWGAEAGTGLSLHECMNSSHAMVCDVSSVASEYLYSGKPFALTDMVGAGAEFPRRFPLAAAAYRLDADAGNLAAVLDDLLDRDPLAPERRSLRVYYLGDFPPERYAEAFLAEARACLSDHRKKSAV